MESYEQRLALAFERRGLQPNTCLAYRKVIRRFAEYHGRPLEELDAEDVMAFVDHLRVDHELSSRSLRVYYSALSFLYGTALGRRDVMLPVIRRKDRRKVPQILSVDEVDMLLRAIVSPIVRAVCMVMYGSGLRVSEACRLQVHDIDSRRGVLRVRNGKGGHDRYSILGPRLLGELRAYYRCKRPAGPLLFPGHRNPSRPFTRAAVNNGIREALELTKLRKRATAHTLRHCFATHLVESGTDLQTVQALMGHRSIRSTAQYITLGLSTLSQTRSPLDRPPPKTTTD